MIVFDLALGQAVAEIFLAPVNQRGPLVSSRAKTSLKKLEKLNEAPLKSIRSHIDISDRPERLRNFTVLNQNWNYCNVLAAELAHQRGIQLTFYPLGFNGVLTQENN